MTSQNKKIKIPSDRIFLEEFDFRDTDFGLETTEERQRRLRNKKTK